MGTPPKPSTILLTCGRNVPAPSSRLRENSSVRLVTSEPRGLSSWSVREPYSGIKDREKVTNLSQDTSGKVQVVCICRVRPGMDGREQETMEEDEESGSEVSSSEDEDEDEKVLPGFQVLKETWTIQVPECPFGTKKMWEGYSLLHMEGNERAHGQDLGMSGACLPKFSPMPFLFCDINFMCNFASRDDKSYWLSTVAAQRDLPDKPLKGRRMLDIISRCVVCETKSVVMAVHSQAPTIPDCPMGWMNVWTGYSFLMHTAAGEGSGQALHSPGSCLEKFRPAPFVEYHGAQGTCHFFANKFSFWLASLPDFYTPEQNPAAYEATSGYVTEMPKVGLQLNDIEMRIGRCRPSVLGESKSPAETLKTGKRSSDSPKTLLEKSRVRPDMDGREQENMEEYKESGAEDSGSEESSWKKKKEDEEALREAAWEGDTDRVKQLLAEGVNPNAAGGLLHWTSLHQAARYGHHETVSALLAAGADVNARDDDHDSALHWAAWGGHHETVSVLLTAGADVNVRNGLGDTPLHEAATYGYPKCVEILLQHGADAGLRNEDGQTAEDIAADEDTRDAGFYNKDEEDRITRGRKEILKLLRQQNNEVRTRKKEYDPVLVRFYEDSGMTEAKKDCPLIEEAAKQSGKTVDQVKNFIGNYRRFKSGSKRSLPTDDKEADNITGHREDLGMSAKMGDSSVPLEIQLRGPRMQQLYSRACRQGARPVHSVRGLVVGQFRSGKTCVVRRLTGEKAVENEPITDGIEISPSVMTKTWRKAKEEPDEFKETMAERLAEQQERDKPRTRTSSRTGAVPTDTGKAGEQKRKRTLRKQQKASLKGKATHTQQTAKRLDETSRPANNNSPPGARIQLATEFYRPHWAPQYRQRHAVGPGTLEIDTRARGGTQASPTGTRRWTAVSFPRRRLDPRCLVEASRGDRHALPPHCLREARRALPSGGSMYARRSAGAAAQDRIGDDVSRITSRQTQPQPQGIPDEVITKAKERLQGGVTEEQLGTAEHPRLSLWDFGGQATYYGSHQCFFTYRGIYILVMSLLQKLSDPVPDLDYKAAADNLVTGRDYLDHWLNSVRTHTLVHGREQTGEPRVVLVLTHKDRVDEPDIEKYKKDIRDHISGKAAGKHVLPKEVPMTWLHLKSKLMDKRREDDPFCRFQDVVDLARSDDVGITDDSHVADILTFLHDLGDIIFINEPVLRDHVALRPQVMIDVFKTIITVPEYQQDRSTDGEVAEMWRRLETEGILSDRLLTIIWTKADQKMQKPFLLRYKPFLKRLMEKYYLLCNASPIGGLDDTADEPEKEEIYFVPSLLAAKLNDSTLYPGHMRRCRHPLYVVFDNMFLPSGMFYRLQAICVRRFGLQESHVFAGCGRFPTDDVKQQFVVTKVKHYLKVELLSAENQTEFTQALPVRKFLSSCLFEIKEKWIPSIQYDWCFGEESEKETGTPVFHPLSDIEQETATESNR
ncbi:hypothetical protein Bbelb_401100 [Branchiostoma belcheri]|nr:hypothetical protein Bbelb_401100 [Branchiostoma belcheri]